MSHTTGLTRYSLLICLIFGCVLAGAPVAARTPTRSSTSAAAAKKKTVSAPKATKATKSAPPAKSAAPARKKASTPESSFEAWTASIASAEQDLGESWTAVIEDLATTETIFEYQGSRRLVPASNRKLITFGMALETLGPEYQFQTEFGLTAPTEPGHPHYHGDVILRADGDPSLTDPFLSGGKNPAEIFRIWAKTLKDAGITQIVGNLIIDASAFGEDQNAYPLEIWGPNHKDQTYAPIPSALALCQNLMRVTVNPGSDAGKPGRVEVYPASEGITIINNTHTSARGARGVTAVYNEEEKALELSGSVRRGGVEVATLPIPHPLNYIGLLLFNSIRDEGIKLDGKLIIRTAPLAPGTAPVLAQRMGTHESPPLVQMLYLMMQQSNNFLAEQLWHAAAARIAGTGDNARARQAEIDWYRRHGLSWIEPGWDGSGLSRKDLFSARELAAISRSLYNTAYQGIMLKVLPTAGESGTLRHRASSTMDGRVTAKTGTLAGVSSLSGFIRDEQGRPRFVFSVLGNAPHDTNGRLVMRINQLVTIAIHRLDEDIAAGRRPTLGPLPPPGTNDFKYALSIRSLAAGSSDLFGAEAASMGAEKEVPGGGIKATTTTTTATLHLPPVSVPGGAALGPPAAPSKP